MQRGARELWWAAAGIAAITALYLVVVNRLQTVPTASSLFGHGIGILGFLLMLATEILYSLRKRSRQARWGRTASWLRFHIFTGLVGPYMVLLHTAWKFNQLAGLVMLLTVIVVVSGFIGRYIYTAVPRTTDGVVIERQQLETEIAAAEAELQVWLAQRPAAGQTLALRLAALPTAGQDQLLMVIGRTFIELGYRWQWRRERARHGCHSAPAGRPAGETRRPAAAVAASGGVAGDGAPAVGHLARRAHPNRHGALHCRLRTHRRGVVLRHSAALEGAYNARTSPRLHLRRWPHRRPGHFAADFGVRPCAGRHPLHPWPTQRPGGRRNPGRHTLSR